MTIQLKTFIVSLPLLTGIVLTLANPWPRAALADGVDRIVAVVEDDVILESELQKKIAVIREGLSRSGTEPPSGIALARQVLDRLILEKIQIHLAEKSGFRVDDETLRQAVQQIAQKNNLTPEELRSSLRAEGIEYPDFLEQIRGELAQQRLRTNQVNSQIKISDREIQHWLDSRGKGSANPNTEYLVGHILIATPQAAPPAAVQEAREKADKLIAELRKGLDFKQASLSSSDSSEALKGGDLGWRKQSELPSLFADIAPKMKKGEIEGPIRSPSGFHIIKLLDQRGGNVELITKTHVRHILLKPNELLTNDDARKKLESIKARIEAGDDFGDLARGNSDDKGSAVKGGDLGFVTPGALVPEFEEAMNNLKPKQLSEPVQSQFGWHLIQVLERQESDDTAELLKKQAQDEIFKRKVEEETELWLRRIRDEAYVEIRVPELAPEGQAPTTPK
ncbi:MAG: peptidylprolyl isomerase [Methylococcaceae bacterium]|nr:peptidylprolyl isomerase [Methylococcaceae bacterium]